MTSHFPRIIVLAPGGLVDPGVVVAGCRAGALGAFDFGLGFDPGRAAEAARRASEYVVGREFGLRVSADALEPGWLAGMPDRLGLVIVTEVVATDWAAALEILRRSGRRGLAEVTSRASAHEAARAGFEGLIVAGHEAGGRGSDESSFILLQAVAGPGGGAGLGPGGDRADGRPRRAWRRGRRAWSSTGRCCWRASRRSTDRPESGSSGWDGGETRSCWARNRGRPVRVQATPGSAALARLKAPRSEGGRGVGGACSRDELGWQVGQVWAVGQDAALAAGLARRFVTVGGIVQAVERAIDEGLAAAAGSGRWRRVRRWPSRTARGTRSSRGR